MEMSAKILPQELNWLGISARHKLCNPRLSCKMVRTRSQTKPDPKPRDAGLVELVAHLERDVRTLQTRLAEERRSYREARTEVIQHFTSPRKGQQCLTCGAKRAVPMLPCAHMCVCVGCVVRLDHCPVCRARISDVIVQTSSAFCAPLWYLNK